MSAFIAPTRGKLDACLQSIRGDGFAIVEDLLPPETVHAFSADLDDRFAKTPFCLGDFYGERTKRFGGLLKRSAHAESFVAHDFILQVAQEVLGPFCDRWNLNLTQALELHPGQISQAPHRDEDMWRGPKGSIEYLINVMWPLTPFTKSNGATVVWPGSHADRTPPKLDHAVVAEMAPGSALIFLGSTLHGAGANRSSAPRRGMIVSYCLGWLKPYENQWLVYPPPVARAFSPDLAALIGYQQHRPNLGNYEGQCPSVLLDEKLDEYLGAIDELTPLQASHLAEFKRLRRGTST